MITRRLADLLDEWQALTEWSDPAAWFADPRELANLSTDERILALSLVGARALLEAGVAIEPTPDPPLSSWLIPLLDVIGQWEAAAEAAHCYEARYGGLGEDHDAYRRGCTAFRVAAQLSDRLARLGEQDTALRLQLFAHGLALLPSWDQAFTFEVLTATEKAYRAEEPDESNLANPGFLMLYPIAKALQLGGDGQAYLSWLNDYLTTESRWLHYNREFQRQVAAFKQFLLHDSEAAQPDQQAGATGLPPEQLFQLLEPVLTSACQAEAAKFLHDFLQAESFEPERPGAPDDDSAIGVLFRQCRGHDPVFLEVLGALMQEPRFSAEFSDEARAGWEQLLQVVKLADALAGEGVPPETIRQRVLASASALRYRHSVTAAAAPDPARGHALRLVYALTTCVDAPRLETFILEHAAEFDEEFLLAVHQELEAADAMQVAAVAQGQPITEDVTRIRRRAEIVVATIDRDVLPPRVDRGRLHDECLIEALLHAGLSQWSLYRRSTVLCRSVPSMRPPLRTALTQRLQRAAGAEREVLSTTLDLCEQVISTSAAGMPVDRAIDRLALTLAVQEAADEYSMLGSASSSRQLRRLWLIGSQAHADGERQYDDELLLAQAAQDGTLGQQQLPASVWRSYLQRLQGAEQSDEELEDFIHHHTEQPASDDDQRYFRAYLHATRAVLAMARGDDPSDALAQSLGHAARVGVHPLIALFVPCWLIAAYYATGRVFQFYAFGRRLDEHLPAVRNGLPSFLLRQFLPAFDALGSLALCRVEPEFADRILERLSSVEEHCSGLMQGWSLRAWMQYWLASQGLRPLWN